MRFPKYSNLLDISCGIIRAQNSKEGYPMKIEFWTRKEDPVLTAEYRPLREKLARAGLSERALRRMAPEKRVKTLEKAHLNPYDYIFLACG